MNEPIKKLFLYFWKIRSSMVEIKGIIHDSNNQSLAGVIIEAL